MKSNATSPKSPGLKRGVSFSGKVELRLYNKQEWGSESELLPLRAFELEPPRRVEQLVPDVTTVYDEGDDEEILEEVSDADSVQEGLDEELDAVTVTTSLSTLDRRVSAGSAMSQSPNDAPKAELSVSTAAVGGGEDSRPSIALPTLTPTDCKTRESVPALGPLDSEPPPLDADGEVLGLDAGFDDGPLGLDEVDDTAKRRPADNKPHFTITSSDGKTSRLSVKDAKQLFRAEFTRQRSSSVSIVREGIFGQEEVERITASRNQMVVIRDCKNATFEVTSGKAKAVQVYNCEHVQIRFNTLVGDLDLHKSRDVTVKIAGKCGSMRIESCESVLVSYEETPCTPILLSASLCGPSCRVELPYRGIKTLELERIKHTSHLWDPSTNTFLSKEVSPPPPRTNDSPDPSTIAVSKIL